MIVPLALGFGLGWFWLPESDWRFAQSLFIGVALAITAVPVAVKVLLDMDQLQSKVGQVIIAAAVMDDVLSLVLLAVLTAMISTTEELTASTLLMIGLNTLIFFVIVWIVGRYVLPRTAGILNRFKLEHADFSLLLIMGLGFSVLAEALGMHFLIGAFASGVLFSRNVVGEKTHHKLETYTEAITVGLLAPVFFASIGMHLKLSAVTEAPMFLLCLLLAATAGKFLGSGLTARLTGFTTSQSLAIGSAMNARGAVEIIIADIALRAGLFEHPSPTPPSIEYLFSAIVIMAIVTTLISPFALRALLPNGKS
jgi:Kef-type K+ transport system membrane component KefB